MSIKNEGDDILFSEMSLADLIKEQIGKVRFAVATTNVNEVLSVPVQDQVEIILTKLQLIVPILLEDQAYSDEPHETTLRMKDGYGRELSVLGMRYITHIPFDGLQGGLFRHHPSTRTLNPPAAKLSHRELIISLIAYDNFTTEDLNREIDKTVADIKQYLEWQRPQVEVCNNEIKNSARQKIEERKARILQAKNIAASLRYPLKRRADALQTYVSSELRRKVIPVRPTPLVDAEYAPEPTIDEAEYQHILKVVGGMALMMERSPTTFSHLKEEQIRDFFLLVLNGHYEGKATGETFNGAGKTDILVRDGDRNLFIGECKIWDGPKTLTDAISQLFSYLTWRDTKSAILIFSRHKGFTKVLETIKTTVDQHAHKKRMISEDETRFGYVFGRPDDPNREIIVTIMAFPVPN